MTLRTHWAGSLLAGSIAAILVNVASAETAETPDHDFRPALTQLADLGLPDMSGAVWSKNPNADRDYQLSEIGISFTGIWKLGNDPLTLLEPGRVEPRVWNPEDEATAAPRRGGLMGALRSLGEKSRNAGKSPAERYPPTDLKSTVDKITNSLTNPKNQEELGQWLQYSGTESLGRLLLFATQAHAAGETDLANRLTNTLFHVVPDREPILDSAISQIASVRYRVIATRFFEDHDWSAYHKSTAELVDTFPRGWSGTLGLSILLPLLEKRASGNPPPEPSLPGVTLEPGALRQLQRLVEPPREDSTAASDQPPEGFDPAMLNGIDWSDLPPSIRGELIESLGYTGESSSSFWLIEPSKEQPPTADPQAILRHSGMDGFIALVAVIGDDTLTHARRGSSRYGRHSLSFGYDNSDPAELASRSFDTISRPETRGEVALRLVAGTMPIDESDLYGSLAPEDVRDLALEFWKEHREKPPLELAAVIMQQGGGSQAAQVATSLATSDDPERNELFTRQVLASETPLLFANIVLTYAREKKADAREFATRYSELLRKELNGVDLEDAADLPWQIRQLGGIEPLIKQISVAVGLSSLSDLVRDAMNADEEEFNEISRSMFESLAAAEPEQRLTALGKCLPDASPERRAQICSSLLYSGMSGGEEPEPVEPTPEIIELWRPLIEDKAKLEVENLDRSWMASIGANTSGEAAAVGFEALCDPATGVKIRELGSINEDWKSVIPFIVGRVTARLAGETPPPWPDASKVDESRLAEIVNSVADTSPDEIPALVRSLSPDERAAWLDWTMNPGEPEVPESLIALRDQVTGLKSGSTPEEEQARTKLAAELGITTGLTADKDLLTKIAQVALADYKKWSGSAVYITAAPLALGVNISVIPAKTNEEMSGYSYMFNTNQMIMEQHATESPAVAVLSVNRSATAWEWKDEKAAPVTIDESIEPLAALDQLADVFSNKLLEEFRISLTILSREDIAKFNDSP